MTLDDLHKDNKQSVADSWFDEMVANLRYDQTLLEHDILEDDKRKVYDAFIAQDLDFIHDYAIQNGSAYFITKMVEAYFSELIQVKSKPTKIALELSNSKILVWAEIVEDDEVMENALILAEAKINAHFSQFGFHISTTIIENSDDLQVPDHYKNVFIS